MALATASDESERSAATTLAAPRYFAAATTSEPIGPAPLTTTSRPRTSPARCTACSATASGSARAPCSVLTPSGSGRIWSARTTRSSLNPPSVCGSNAAEPK